MAKTKSENSITVKKLARVIWERKARSAVCPLKESRGELFGLLRPNGAGKTTTLEISARVRVGLLLWLMRVLGEATRKVKSPIGVQLQSSSFFENLKEVQP